MTISTNRLRRAGDITLSMMQASAREGVTLRRAGEPVLDQLSDEGCCQVMRRDGGQLHRCSRPVDPAAGRHPGLHRCASGDWWTHKNAYLVWYPESDGAGTFNGYEAGGEIGFVSIENIGDARVMVEDDARCLALSSIRRRVAWEWYPNGPRPQLTIPLMIKDWPYTEPEDMLDTYAEEVRAQLERALRARDHWDGDLQSPVAVDMVELFWDQIGKSPIPLP